MASGRQRVTGAFDERIKSQPMTKIYSHWTDFRPGNTNPLKFKIITAENGQPGLWNFRTNLDENDLTVLMSDKELKVFMWRMWEIYGRRYVG